MKAHRDDRVFLVRMWRERDSTGQSGWRGSVHDVAAGRRFYLTSANEINDFVTVSLLDSALDDSFHKSS